MQVAFLFEEKAAGKIGDAFVIEFGTRISGVGYVDRPGAYAIIQDESNAIALVRTQQGFLLPGGGIEPAEGIVGALQREILEELGYQSTIGEKLCTAVQYLYSESEQQHFRKIGHFFRATLTEKVCEPIELDHDLMWCSPEESLAKLTQEFQAWAVRQAFKIGM